jgi:hypothetical protein
MTDHTARAIRAIRTAGLLAAACSACAGCSLLPSRAAGPAPARPPAHATAPAGPPAAASPGLAAILPFSPSRLQAAAALAARFAAAYETWSWRQPPAAWLAGLRPMTSSGLYAALAQAADTPGVLAQRDHARQAATAAQIRDLTPGSVTVTVTVRQAITATSGTSQTFSSFAVTLTPRQGGGWTVYDIEPASAGNS